MNRSLAAARPNRIAIFRALQLGDLLCLVPALRALRAWAPQARITLIGLPWAAEFAGRFPGYIDDFIAFPGFPGFPEQECDADRLKRFSAELAGQEFDLALQMHGSGTVSNLVLALVNARHRAGFCTADGYRPVEGTFIPWPEAEPEPLRYLQLTDALGIPRQGEHPEWPLEAGDWDEWDLLARRHDLAPRKYVCVHPGARMPSRRWPLDRFAQVASTLAEDGWRIVVTGSKAEAELTRALVKDANCGAIDLAGATSLGGLAALLSRAALAVCNDTGTSHMAAAVRTPSVVIASGSDVRRWAPLDADRHRVFWYDVPCRPCEHHQCPIGHPCALGVSVKSVVREARGQLRRTLRHAA
jgi:ADP-heptose:LPS heptosyltransferase